MMTMNTNMSTTMNMTNSEDRDELMEVFNVFFFLFRNRHQHLSLTVNSDRLHIQGLSITAFHVFSYLILNIVE